MYQPLGKFRFTKYWRRNWFELSPATDQTLLTSTPSTHDPGIVRTTADGPSPQVDWDPTSGEVAVGKVATGPAPQTSAPGLAGDRNAVNMRLPRPVVLEPPVKLGWVTMGRIVRLMRFQSRPRLKGTTG